MGSGLDNTVECFEILNNGDLLAAGPFTYSGDTALNRIGRWNGSNWSALSGGVSENNNSDNVYAIAELRNGMIAAGGKFYVVGGHAANGIAIYSPTGIPELAIAPDPVNADSNQSVTLSTTPFLGYSNVSYHWLRNNTPVSNGPGGASPNGGTVSGASGSLASPTNGDPVTLTIANAQASDSGDYTLVLSNDCGQSTSTPATVTITPACPADFNADGFLDFFDFNDFVTCFEGGSCPPGKSADFNNDGFADFFDFNDFVTAFETGC